ncbi:MAG TPA: beta-ketoacyl-ACP synthase II [Candidatus Methanoperedens sp.]|nr:beta-ketoacyl-ACP synthase II [Candidatus Methanoperedens sp.]
MGEQARTGALRRVVVTGIGAVSPFGEGIEVLWEGLCAGRSGIKPITHFDTTGYETTIAGEVRGFDPERYLEKKEARKADRFVQFAVAASRMAIDDSGIVITPALGEEFGCVIGAGIGGMSTIEEFHTVLMTKGPKRVSPFSIPKIIINIAPGYVSMIFGLKGPNESVVTACATGNNCIGSAARWIQLGQATAMLAGGSEATITPMGISGFNALKALSTRNAEPERASRPFDAERDGFVMGEGAGVLVLEELGHARARGARIYAEFGGYGATADAFHMTAPSPDGDGAIRCMRRAIRDAGLSPADIGYINAHGTSTKFNDAIETKAIKVVFGAQAGQVPVSSTKSMTGHLLGAAGGVESIVSVLTIARGVIPPTINLEHPDPECDLDYVPNVARRAAVDAVLSNTFGFGGANACLVFKRYSGA